MSGLNGSSGFRPALRDSIALTKTWAELADVLGKEKLTLAPKGGGLVLTHAETGKEIYKISTFKLCYVSLIRHYGAGFPGHSATWLEVRALEGDNAPNRLRKPEDRRYKRKPPPVDDNFDVLEE